MQAQYATLIFLSLFSWGAVCLLFFEATLWLLLFPLSQYFIGFYALHMELSNRIERFFFSFAGSLLFFVCKINVVIHGSDKLILHDEGILLISNHPTRLDWMFVGTAD
jgi:1-acyl-sn-glycerol-3-phosphate acyltransferase